MKFFQMLFTDPSDARESCIAIMGGGGKTSLLNRLGNELSGHYNKVLLTSLTKSASPTEPNTIYLNKIGDLNIAPYFSSHNPLRVMHSIINQYKVSGVTEADLNRLRRQLDLSVFECDGARKRSLKAHTDYDPVVPAYASHVIIVVGADVINTTLKERKVHRPSLFKAVWNITDNFILDIDFVTTVITSQTGYLMKIPFGTQKIYFVNKADVDPQNAKRLASALFNQTSCPSFFGSLRNNFCQASNET